MAKHNDFIEDIPKQVETLGYDVGEFTKTAYICRTSNKVNEAFVKENEGIYVPRMYSVVHWDDLSLVGI